MNLKYFILGLFSFTISVHTLASSDGTSGFSDDELGFEALPFLSPDNDTRVNLMLLQANKNNISLKIPPLHPHEPLTQINPFTAFRVMGMAAIYPEGEKIDSAHINATNISNNSLTTSLLYAGLIAIYPSEFADSLLTLLSQTNMSTSAAQNLNSYLQFQLNVANDSQLTTEQRIILISARKTLTTTATAQNIFSAVNSLPDAEHVGEWKHYIQNAALFQFEDFNNAQAGFLKLSQTATQPWVAETSTYMLIRTSLKQSIQQSADKYGFFDLEKVDKELANQSIQFIDNYIKRYPQGIYRDSAENLYRRVYWIKGELNILAKIYQDTLDKSAKLEQLIPLIDETDNKLLENKAFMQSSDSPTLTLIQSIKRLRDEMNNNPLTEKELTQQLSLLSNAQHHDFSNYLQLAYRFYFLKDYTAVATISPLTEKDNFSEPITFSLQILKGLASMRLNQWEKAEQHWRQLINKPTSYTQQQYLQLVLAETLAYKGTPEIIFTSDSPIKNLRFRALVLKNSANAPLLRQQIKDEHINNEERTIALHTLLSKELLSGKYDDYLQDRILQKTVTAQVQPLANADIQIFEWDGSKTETGYTCSSLDEIVKSLHQQPKNAHQLNCLGEFMRLNDGAIWSNNQFYDFGTLDSLARAPQQFTGQKIDRLTLYLRVIHDTNAPTEEKSYALYRAIRCFAPSGINNCGNMEIPLATRKSWFNQLKTKYKNTKWSKLEYYW